MRKWTGCFETETLKELKCSNTKKIASNKQKNKKHKRKTEQNLQSNQRLNWQIKWCKAASSNNSKRRVM